MKVRRLFCAKDAVTRNASAVAAGAHFLLAALTVVCIVTALAISGDPRKGPGNLLLNAYGLLSFLVPAWFVWGGKILISPVFSLRSVFALDASAVPFFTLAAGFRYTRDFSRFAEGSALLSAFGVKGLSLTIVVIALMEAVAIGALAYKLFPPETVRRKSRPRTARKAVETAPFTVVRMPLDGEIPLMREPVLPNPVDDMLLEELPLCNDEPAQGAELLAGDYTVIAEPGEYGDSFANLIVSAPDYFQLPDCLLEKGEDGQEGEGAREGEGAPGADIHEALESLSPALDGLDTALNDLFAGLPPAEKDAAAGSFDGRDAEADPDTPAGRVDQAGSAVLDDPDAFDTLAGRVDQAGSALLDVSAAPDSPAGRVDQAGSALFDESDALDTPAGRVGQAGSALFDDPAAPDTLAGRVDQAGSAVLDDPDAFDTLAGRVDHEIGRASCRERVSQS
ncbi:MAG: hypothetical protein LBL31_01360, partial [Spirochaetaceae bacterium]|nr:hypothetical protein [Spirochaetaceae bacterium]